MKKKTLKIIGLISVVIILLFIALPTLLNNAGLHPVFEGSENYDFKNTKAVKKVWAQCLKLIDDDGHPK